jgi:hypothetical protein
VKAVMKGVMFAPYEPQVYGRDPHYDPDSWYVTRSVPGLSYEDRIELGKLVEYAEADKRASLRDRER